MNVTSISKDKSVGAKLAIQHKSMKITSKQERLSCRVEKAALNLECIAFTLKEMSFIDSSLLQSQKTFNILGKFG